MNKEIDTKKLKDFIKKEKSPASEVEEFILCKNCGTKTILAMGSINCFEPDEEPYKNGVQEKCGYEDGIEAEVSVGIHWCPKCMAIEDVWVEEPMEKDIRDAKLQVKIIQLEGENAQQVMVIGVLEEQRDEHQTKIAQLEAEKKDLEWGINITGNSVKVIMGRVAELKALQGKGE